MRRRSWISWGPESSTAERTTTASMVNFPASWTCGLNFVPQSSACLCTGTSSHLTDDCTNPNGIKRLRKSSLSPDEINIVHYTPSESLKNVCQSAQRKPCACMACSFCSPSFSGEDLILGKCHLINPQRPVLTQWGSLALNWSLFLKMILILFY